MRTLVIGDIHGGLKALKQLVERIKPTTTDAFIFLGDYVDGWSESAQVIQFLIDFSEQYNCVFIKGNHDVWCEDWLKTKIPDTTWTFHGGLSTIKSYENGFSEQDVRTHLNFFERMKFYHIDANNRLFIHAGFTSMKGPEQEFHKSNYNWDRTLWEMAVTMDKRIEKHSNLYPQRLKLYHEIYIGHTPTLRYDSDTPMHAINVWNVDTGAAFHGKLTALDVDTKEIYQTDTVQSLYPDEKGRNHSPYRVIEKKLKY